VYCNENVDQNPDAVDDVVEGSEEEKYDD